MAEPRGFEYKERGGTVVITHHGREAVVLRGPRAQRFLIEVVQNPQLVMARWTKNYKHGNERQARNHPRNRAASRGRGL